MSTITEVLGPILNDVSKVYNHFWTSRGFAKVGEGKATSSIQRVFSDPANDAVVKKYRGFAAKSIGAAVTKDTTVSNTVAAAVPLMYDPEILDILRTDTPILAQIPIVGWEGTAYKGANIATRTHPIGFLSESESLDLSAQAASGFTMSPITADMTILSDKVSVGDFAEKSAEHQFSVRDTALGARVTEALQFKEQATLYGDPSQAKTDHGLGSSNAFKGMAKTFTDAGMTIDKSAVSLGSSDALIRDIKSELKDLCKRYNVNPEDLWIGTSYDIHDEIDNEITVHGRTEIAGTEANFGYQGLKIWGVPVIPSHNVGPQADWGGAFTPGNDGDVFIGNRRAHWNPSLAPMFTIPLTRNGFAENWALGEYGAFVDRSGGKFGKYLKDYAV